MQYIELVAALAVLQFVFFGAMTAKVRVDSGLKAPAMTGHDGFERMHRVQMNTLETLVAFLPALFLAGQHWSSLLVSGFGVIYLIGRLIYWRAYVADPAKRGLGYVLSIIPTMLLIILAIIGPIMNLVA